MTTLSSQVYSYIVCIIIHALLFKYLSLYYVYCEKQLLKINTRNNII
jgi:hypothetical protein